MTVNEMIAVLKKTAGIARVRKLDIANKSGYSYNSVNRWYRSENPRLRQFVDWANTLGYDVVLRRRERD